MCIYNTMSFLVITAMASWQLMHLDVRLGSYTLLVLMNQKSDQKTK